MCRLHHAATQHAHKRCIPSGPPGEPPQGQAPPRCPPQVPRRLAAGSTAAPRHAHHMKLPRAPASTHSPASLQVTLPSQSQKRHSTAPLRPACHWGPLTSRRRSAASQSKLPPRSQAGPPSAGGAGSGASACGHGSGGTRLTKSKPWLRLDQPRMPRRPLTTPVEYNAGEEVPAAEMPREAEKLSGQKACQLFTLIEVHIEKAGCA